jgi:hypothetical protein
MVVPFGQPNRAKIRLLGATLTQFDQINDGGYGY